MHAVIRTDGALALALDDPDPASGELFLRPKNRIKEIFGEAPDGAGAKVLQFPYWRLENRDEVRRSVSGAPIRLTSYTNGNSATVSYGYTYGGGPTYNLLDGANSIIYPNSVGTVDQTWNADGTLASVEDWNSKTISFGYDANDNTTSVTYPSTTNVTDTFGFNAGDQMTSISDSNGSTLFSATYGRDANGQVSSDSSQPANQQNYQYTVQNQLCDAGGASNTCSSTSPAYQYALDHADNLTTNKGNAQQYNAADELCWTVSGSSGNACNSTPTGATTYNYDNKGNRTSTVANSGSATCYTYDQPNRLTKIQTGTGSSCTSPTTVGTYTYDGTGLRDSKTVSGTTTQFTWDGVGGDLLQQYDGTTKTSFIYGPGGIPLEQIAGSTTTYLHHDQLGSIVLETDSAGATGTATTTDYDPYGNVVSTSGSLTSPFGFSGQYTDSESGLIYLRARYYDPTTAQFMTCDPLVAETIQPYAYANSSPLQFSDPSGELVAPKPPGPIVIEPIPNPLAPAPGAAGATGDGAAADSGGGAIATIAGWAGIIITVLSIPSDAGPTPSPTPSAGISDWPVPTIDATHCDIQHGNDGSINITASRRLSRTDYTLQELLDNGLTYEEAGAILSAQAGLPFDESDYQSGAQKIKYNEKMGGARRINR